MKFEISQEQYEVIIDALSTAYMKADKYVGEEQHPDTAIQLMKERDEFEEVMNYLDEQTPDEWLEGNSSD